MQVHAASSSLNRSRQAARHFLPESVSCTHKEPPNPGVCKNVFLQVCCPELPHPARAWTLQVSQMLCRT